ncbi:replication protein A 70 kDa DNA-binding subunit A-like [Fagus crenata]
MWLLSFVKVFPVLFGVQLLAATKLRIGLAEQTLLAALSTAAVYTEKHSTPPPNIQSPLEEKRIMEIARVARQRRRIIMYKKRLKRKGYDGLRNQSRISFVSPMSLLSQNTFRNLRDTNGQSVITLDNSLHLAGQSSNICTTKEIDVDMEEFIGESDSNIVLNESSEEDGFNYFGNSEQNYDAGSDSCYEDIPNVIGILESIGPIEEVMSRGRPTKLRKIQLLLEESILHNTNVSKVKEIMVERPLKVSDRELHLHNRKTVAEIKEMEWNSETKTKVKPTKSFLWCERCKAEPKFAVPRIQTEVEDATGSTTFILFDNGVEKIIPKTAKELAEMQDEELEKIIGKEYIFQLRLDEYNLKYGRENYTVSRIFDPDISEENSTSNEAEIKKEIPIRCVGTSKSDNYYNNQKTYADKTMDEYSPVRLRINVENMQSDDNNMTIQRIQKRSKATQEKSSKNKKLRSAKNKEKC